MACTPAGDDPQPLTSTPAAPPVAASATATPDASPTDASPSVASTDVGSVLGTAWVTDSDDDGIPDAVEVGVGTDPAVDQCARDPDCGATDGPDPDAVAAAGGNTVVILDASGSMAGPAGGGTKMRAAKRAVTRYVVGLPEFVDAGLIVYGHEGSNSDADKARSCRGIETFAELGTLSHRNVDRVVDRFRPTGWTPIAGALDAARAEFAGVDPEADNRVILVSDGIETCDGDPVAAARRLQRADVSVTVDVVGFDVDAAAARQLERVARVTGGTYTDARSAGQLRSYFDRQYDRLRSLERELNCVAQHRKDVADCYAIAGNNAADGYVLDRFRETASDDRERRDAYRDVIAAVAAGARERSGAVREISDARIEELSAQIDVARARWERRFQRTSRVLMDPCAGPWYPVSARWS